MASKRASFITEIKTELGMRRQVWRKVTEKGGEIRFLSDDHQRRYKAMEDMMKVFSAMTDAEVNKFLLKAETAEQPGTIQSLF